MRKIFEIINQLSSYRMNEVNCGIFQDITKIFRNAFHLCGMTNGKDTNNCHTALVAVSKSMSIRYRNSLRLCGMTVKKFVAFTLAETLIVMGIIGIVSALTLPNLNSSTGEKEKVAKVKKIYQNLEDAQGRAVAIYGPIETWFISDTTKKAATNRYADRIMDFLKVSKDCNQSVNGCFQNKNYRESDDKDHGGGPNAWPDDRKFNLADGTSISLSIEPFGSSACTKSDDTTKPGESNKCGTISVDIDGGLKGKNAYGIDFFQFTITTEGIFPTGMEVSDAGTNITNSCFKNGTSCAGWVVANENMDYLKATNGKCKSNTTRTLSWTGNTTCK